MDGVGEGFPEAPSLDEELQAMNGYQEMEIWYFLAMNSFVGYPMLRSALNTYTYDICI